VDAPNVAGWSPLHFAVRHGRVHAAHMLLDLGAVANMPDKSGHTPEDLARITKDKIKKGILHLEESVQLDDFEKIADMLAEKTKAQVCNIESVLFQGVTFRFAARCRGQHGQARSGECRYCQKIFGCFGLMSAISDSHFEAEDYFGAIEHLQVARDEYARVGMRDESAVIHLS